MPAADYMTTAEVAAYLRVKERTVYDLVSRKAIPCSRVTGKLIFPRRLIDRWVDGQVQLADATPLVPPPIFGGSSDPLLEWALRESGSGLASLFEGSLGGLKRLAAAQAVAAGLHVLEAQSGAYNLDAVRSIAAMHDVVLIEWAERDQGLVIARGNPLAVRGISDLAEKRPRIARRQHGAGSDLLLEALLGREGLDPAHLQASERPALTDMDAAAAVADGAADCALAIGAAARRFGLDFLPLHRERFDIACRRRDYFEAPLQKLFAFTRTAVFAEKAAQLGHYHIETTGTVRFNA